MKIRLHVVWMLIAGILFAGAAGWGLVWAYASRDTVPKGTVALGNAEVSGSNSTIKLGGLRPIAVGGLRIDDAVRLLQRRASQLESLPVTFAANDTNTQNQTWTLAELGVKADVGKAAAELAKLREGSVWQRAKTRFHFSGRLPFSVGWSKPAFVQKVRSGWGYLNANEPANAARIITSDDKIVYRPGSDAYRLDEDAMFASTVEAVDAYTAPGGQWGDGSDGDSGAAEPGSPPVPSIRIPVALRVVHPDVTLARLKAEGVDRKIAAFTTDFSASGAGRAYNVTMTAKTLNDWDLAPGETFDFGKVIELTTEHYGYREAPVIVNGVLTPGIGGGICQVSSTLYNAALLIGLDMTERRNHSLPVSYLPMGRDATFAEGAINFRFKNTTGRHLIIRTVVEGRKLTVKLFGSMPANVSYALDSKTVQVLDPPIKEVASNAVPSGSKQLVSSGKPGYVVETYRTKLVNGKAVSRTRISRDTYKAQPAVYRVAPGTPGLPPGGGTRPKKELIEDGIGE
ncbi:VanW family protein [Paenibacillus humicola]|uniref:VanW family protein n=1 Tax=Paenibacillus humicola TaxID=3110540 RepID=UPI00237B7494|nr:VanW family protein [Paenibacillus humicola]